MSEKKIICLEFNELCPDLLSDWMDAGKLPNFRRFYDQSLVLTAVADEPGPENLEPWIQWYSLHTGLPYSQHGVQNLTDGPNAPYPDVWTILSDAGLRVANCGSMNARALSKPGSLFLPDPWCTNQQAYPKEWSAYHRLVAGLVQDSSIGLSQSVGWQDYAAFISFVATHGLSGRTAVNLVSQVVSDSVLRKDTNWMRAALLDQIQFDVFSQYWIGERPDFSTFFLNSTAHYQHAYWHCAFPEQFANRPNEVDLRRFGSAILHGYQQMDLLLERFFKLEERGASLMLCTALSQRGIGRTDQVLYRLSDPEELLSRLAIPHVDVLPVMSEQYCVCFENALLAEKAKGVLDRLRMGDAPLLLTLLEGDTLLIGAFARREIASDTLVSGFADGGTVRYCELFYRLPTIKATTHHPESLMWIKNGSHKVVEERVSILDWLPTIMDLYALNDNPVEAARARGPGRSFRNLLEVSVA